MTREEAIKVLEKQFDKSCGNYRYQNAEKLDFEDALWVAIYALRQQEQEGKAATGEGLRCKYIVRKADTGEGVDGCFVLRPDRDRAAVAALRAYAAATDNDVLATDILNWVGQEINEPLTLD